MQKIRQFLYVSISLFIAITPLGPAKAARDGALPSLMVYLVEFPPYSLRSSDGSVEGEMALKVRAFLDQTDLEYEVVIVPWQRAYRVTTTRDNALIGFLDRTEEREDRFHWLMPMVTTTYQLITSKENEFPYMTRSQVLENGGRALCITLAVECQMLADFGFPEERIWALAGHTGNEPLPELILRGRAEFWLADLNIYASILEKQGLDPSDFLPLFEVNTTTSYLAASTTIHPAILERLMAVSNLNAN